jgi:hypothetical protein
VKLLHDKPPARRRFQRNLELLASEPANELADTGSVSGVTRARETSPVEVSTQSAVICARCWSSPIRIVIRGLLKLHGLNACAAQRHA